MRVKINCLNRYAIYADGNKESNLINHTINYRDDTTHYDCNSYLNKNIEIFANVEQFTNLPSEASDALMCWFISRGENLSHNNSASEYRNIQEAIIVKNDSGWKITKWRRFAIDTTVFAWNQVN